MGRAGSGPTREEGGSMGGALMGGGREVEGEEEEG